MLMNLVNSFMEKLNNNINMVLFELKSFNS